jgi:hypothetical protein
VPPDTKAPLAELENDEAHLDRNHVPARDQIDGAQRALLEKLELV